MIAPTLHEIFEQWKALPVKDESSWTQHWEHVWAQHIAMYLSMGWHLIPLAARSKKPLNDYQWDVDKKLDQVRAMDFVRNGCNLGVIAGRSGLVILDFDSEVTPELKQLASLTPTVRTPRGYQFFTKSDMGTKNRVFELYCKKLKRRYPNMDTPRTNIMYALVPPSQSDFYNEKEEMKPDYRVRLWMTPMPENPMEFSRFVRIAT